MTRRSRIIGMMSGTSVDSIDAAVCDIAEGTNGRLTADLIAFHEHPIKDELRRRIFRLFGDGPGSLSLACSLNFEIGQAFAEAAQEVLRKNAISQETITAVASHGQTAYHIAPHMVEEAAREGASDTDRVYRSFKAASTLQIGEASVIAEKLRLPVVTDFRVADMAAGGNGAPLVPFADYHLFSRPGETIVVHNVGGIANCTVLPASDRLEDVIAFDTGPGNMIIDAFVQHFYPGERCDMDGKHAKAGRVVNAMLDRWMKIPYISAPPPKSTGRELFGCQFVVQAMREFPAADADDYIATATLFTARSLAYNLQDHVLPRWPVTELLLAGGGAHNPYIVELITRDIHEVSLGRSVRVRMLDDFGFTTKSRECVGFALLGHARLFKIAGNIPSATGARHAALLGKIVHPPPQ